MWEGTGGGFKELDAGEGLTSDPMVYAGVVYFSTYIPNSDRCEMGEGRLYGLNYNDCSGALDTDGDGTAEDYTSAEGYVSGAAVSEFGTVYFGTSNPTTDGSSAVVETISVADAGLLGTRAVAWMEMF